MSNMVLALYDFASKQEFIYRTSKIREISGASTFLDGLYEKFAALLQSAMRFEYDLETAFDLDGFCNGSLDGTVLYDGGGSLLVLFKSAELYRKANEVLSVYLLKTCPTLTLLTACADFDDNFETARSAVYVAMRVAKNRRPASELTAVTPFTQVDPMTFMPVVYKGKSHGEEQSLSADRKAKQDAFIGSENDNLDALEGLTAVIYIDGNSMGKKLMKLKNSDWNEGVAALRKFSKMVKETYVRKPLEDFAKKAGDTGYRQVIGGGDEITIICDAAMALTLTKIYFDALEESNKHIATEDEKNYSCAGIAVFHSKTPFNLVYELAEAACESAKKKAHVVNGNYFDFYYCHAGVTTDFDTLREREQSITARPYEYHKGFEIFESLGETLRAAGRSNVKALGVAAQKGGEAYPIEEKRVNAYLGANKLNSEKNSNELRYVYDMAEFYDIWFAKEGK